MIQHAHIRLSLCSVLAAAAFIPPPDTSSASAEIVETTPGHFSCDVADGHYERTDIGRFVRGNILSARFHFLEGTDNISYAPVAGYIITFHNKESIEIHVVANPGHPRKLDVQIGNSSVGSKTIVQAPRSEPVEVTVTVAGGTLSVASAGRSQSIPIGARRIVGVEASCQSGRFEIEFPSQVQQKAVTK